MLNYLLTFTVANTILSQYVKQYYIAQAPTTHLVL